MIEQRFKDGEIVAFDQEWGFGNHPFIGIVIKLIQEQFTAYYIIERIGVEVSSEPQAWSYEFVESQGISLGSDLSTVELLYL